jgi:hypothetical protein
MKNDANSFIARDNIKMYKIDRGNLQCHAPYFTTQAFFETWDEVFEGDFVTLPRTVAFRAQKYVSGKWPGDCDNTYDYPSGLKANLSAFQNLGIAGFAFWGSDTGGFPDPPGNNVTIRWAQFSCFCPIFETAGTPYAYSEHYRNIYRKYAELYTQLFPYRWTYARIAHEKGHPIARALVLEYPDDPNTYGQDYEFLYGDWMLVAPVVDAGTSRDVYLPQGQWIDFWHGTEYTGPQTIASYPAPEDTIPLFVKAGAIIPMIGAQQTWHNCTVDPMRLVIYPSGTSSFHVYGDTIVYGNRTEPYTNLKDNTYECKVDANSIEIKIGDSNSAYELHVHYDMLPSSVIVDSRPLPKFDYKADYDAAYEGWYYGGGIFYGCDGVRTINIKVAKSSGPHVICFTGKPDRPVENVTKGKRYGYIQHAIDDAAEGDEIVVSARAYQHRENVDFKGKSLRLRSTDPGDAAVVAATVIHGDGWNPVVTFSGGEDVNCVLSGFTITGGDTGIYCSRACPTITRCNISGNKGDGIEWWAWLGCRNPVLYNCIITNNEGCGVRFEGSGHKNVVNCVIAGNLEYGILGRYVTATNCTVLGNSLSGVAGYKCSVVNSIVRDNDQSQLFGSVTASYSNVEDGWPGEGNIDADPCFVEQGHWDTHGIWIGGNYHLVAGSPVIDIGDDTAVPADAVDLDGDGDTAELVPYDLDLNARRVDGNNDGNCVVDMGAYEYFIPPVEVWMKFTPQALNPGSKGNWVKAHFVLPEEFDVEDVDANRPAVVEPAGIESDYMTVFVNDDGLVEIEAAFERSRFCQAGLSGEVIEVRVEDRFVSGQGFFGTDTIKVTDNTFRDLAVLASYWLQELCGEPDWCGISS